MKLTIKPYLHILLLAIILFGFNDLPAQCAMCRQAAESSIQSDPGSPARNLNAGILYLMALPYLMIGFIFRKQIVQGLKKLKARF